MQAHMLAVFVRLFRRPVGCRCSLAAVSSDRMADVVPRSPSARAQLPQAERRHDGCRIGAPARRRLKQIKIRSESKLGGGRSFGIRPPPARTRSLPTRGTILEIIKSSTHVDAADSSPQPRRCAAWPIIRASDAAHASAVPLVQSEEPSTSDVSKCAEVEALITRQFYRRPHRCPSSESGQQQILAERDNYDSAGFLTDP